jgi:hypothetical protein
MLNVSFKQILVVVIVVFVVLGMLPGGALADGKSVDTLLNTLSGFLKLVPEALPVVGVGIAAGGGVDLLKLIRVKGLPQIPDGYAGVIALVVNLIAFVVLSSMGKLEWGRAVQPFIYQLGMFIPAVIQIISLQAGARGGHSLMKALVNAPGFSLSAKSSQQGVG